MGFLSGGLIAVFALASAVSLHSLAVLNDATQLITTDPLPGMALMSRAEGAILELRGDTWRHVSAADPAEKAEMEKSIATLTTEAETALLAYAPTALSDDDRALFGKLKPVWARYRDGLQTVLQLSRENRNAEAHTLYVSGLAQTFSDLRQLLVAEGDINRQYALPLPPAPHASVEWSSFRYSKTVHILP